MTLPWQVCRPRSHWIRIQKPLIMKEVDNLTTSLAPPTNLVPLNISQVQVHHTNLVDHLKSQILEIIQINQARPIISLALHTISLALHTISLDLHTINLAHQVINQNPSLKTDPLPVGRNRRKGNAHETESIVRREERNQDLRVQVHPKNRKLIQIVHLISY